MDPDWLDGQHRMLSEFDWFRDKGTINAYSACRELNAGVNF